jgi:phosphoglycerate dehydrogenase-like enzyme
VPSTLLVTIPSMIGESDLAPLRERSSVFIHEAAAVSESDLARLCEGHDYLMLNYDVVKHLTADFYSDSRVRALTAISTDITGMDWASPQAAATNGVMLLNTPHYSTESVAESILCEVLLHSRQQHAAYIDQVEARDVLARKGFNLLGKTAGVIGLGDIGIRVAALLSSVGMNVVGWSRTHREGFEPVTLPELFDRAKVICLALKTVKDGPEANMGIIGADLLDRCQGTVIVNLANHGLLDGEALTRQLRIGAVSGYSVERSTKLLKSPLGALQSVHFPPANAWLSDESLALLRQTWVGNVLSAIEGHPQNVYFD